MDIVELLPSIEHTAALVGGKHWDAMDDEMRIRHLEVMSPSAVKEGVTPELVQQFLDGEFEKVRSSDEALASQVGDEAEASLSSTIADLISFVKTDVVFMAQISGTAMLVAHTGGTTIIAKLETKDSPAVTRIELCNDPDQLVYAKAQRMRIKSTVDHRGAFWIADEQTDDMMEDIMDDDPLVDSL